MILNNDLKKIAFSIWVLLNEMKEIFNLVETRESIKSDFLLEFLWKEISTYRIQGLNICSVVSNYQNQFKNVCT